MATFSTFLLLNIDLSLLFHYQLPTLDDYFIIRQLKYSWQKFQLYGVIRRGICFWWSRKIESIVKRILIDG